MTPFYDDSLPSRAAALHQASKQAQAGAERARIDSDRRNGALMRTDPRLNRLLKAFTALPDQDREAFVDRALAAGRVTR